MRWDWISAIKKIAFGCPSQRTIARWDKKLAVRCIFSVVQEMKADEAKYLAILCDHGKRNGIEHYVKIFVWGGWKSNCLMPPLVGEMNERVIKYVSDAGGGAGLPNLEPKLKENGTLPDHGRGCNCQYHGHNKGYENASTAAFGSQGLEKANIFQAGYQYSVLVKAIKEDVGLKVLAEIREIVLMNLLKSEKLQKEVKKNNYKAYGELVDQLLKKNTPDPSKDALDLGELAKV